MGPGPAALYARALAWQEVGTGDGERLLWKRVAYACRYGKGVSVVEALRLDSASLSAFLQAVGDIVQEESRTASRK